MRFQTVWICSCWFRNVCFITVFYIVLSSTCRRAFVTVSFSVQLHFDCRLFLAATLCVFHTIRVVSDGRNGVAEGKDEMYSSMLWVHLWSRSSSLTLGLSLMIRFTGMVLWRMHMSVGSLSCSTLWRTCSGCCDILVQDLFGIFVVWHIGISYFNWFPGTQRCYIVACYSASFIYWLRWWLQGCRYLLMQV